MDNDPTGGGVALLLIIVAIYFLPTIIAFARRHHQRVPILVVDIFLGWTFIGWLIALVWSVSYVKPQTWRYE